MSTVIKTRRRKKTRRKKTAIMHLLSSERSVGKHSDLFMYLRCYADGEFAERQGRRDHPAEPARGCRPGGY